MYEYVNYRLLSPFPFFQVSVALPVAEEDACCCCISLCIRLEGSLGGLPGDLAGGRCCCCSEVVEDEGEDEEALSLRGRLGVVLRLFSNSRAS